MSIEKQNLKSSWDLAVECLLDELLENNSESYKKLSEKQAFYNISTTWFKRVKAHYFENHRMYHTWQHVEQVLIALDTIWQNEAKIIPSRKDRAAATLAAFFHDAIYNPEATFSINEKKSAELFQQFVAELLIIVNKDQVDCCANSIIVRDVVDCILATINHLESGLKARKSNNVVVKVFLDADLSILGQSSKEYDLYAFHIREEYKNIEKTHYCSVRANILKGFLHLIRSEDWGNEKKEQDKALYLTDFGQLVWEKRAQSNLIREIDFLKRNHILGEDQLIK
jgi:predicted metal-dependent HD superfamily phosphohydrolase